MAQALTTRPEAEHLSMQTNTSVLVLFFLKRVQTFQLSKSHPALAYWVAENPLLGLKYLSAVKIFLYLTLADHVNPCLISPVENKALL